jgi:hypothetical protein
MKNRYMTPVQSFAFGGIANPVQRAMLRGSDKRFLEERQRELDEFEAQRQFPYQQVQFQRDMISGLPTGSVTNTPANVTGVGALLSALGGGTAAASALGYKDVGELLKALGLDLGPKEPVDE